ncbi:HTH_Tnp_Tc3_2 domain-containing protein [Trichonephila clavipes]|uniref:HTH_Tnp_Tc3_2 domain-containing protein n=1 Tax=Trichonephila clavipes TaxID=2585209 RepID=A0A8X6S4Y5_TRICX|nr:HTH_Tnp_Tc3_2 domain-containing protein [Trichonephila clavipes]
MPRVRSRKAYQHVSDFDKSRIVAYRDCAVYHNTVLLLSSVEIQRLLAEYEIDRFRTVIWNAVLDLNFPPITSSREDMHVTRMALMDRAATSRSLSQELGSFARQQVSARTIRRRMLQHGLSARRLWLQLPLTLHHRQERLQWWDQRQTWCMNDETSLYQNNSGSAYSIKMVTSVFSGIGVNAHWRRAFVIVILAHKLALWYGGLLDTRLGHLLFAMKAL